MLLTHKPKILIQPYVIAIPSYQRSELIIKKTLSTLFKHDINPTLITIFLANKEEYNIYSKLFQQPEKKIPNLDRKYKKFLNSVSMAIGEKGLKNQRNFISDFYLDKQKIIQMDDDIEGVKMLVVDKKDEKNRKKWDLINVPNLDKLCKDAFKMSEKVGAYLWGIYPIANAYFMSPKVTSELKFIVGPMFGIINRKDGSLKLSIDEKENVERTLQYFVKDGAVLRLNNVTVVTKYYSNPGGMQTDKDAKKQRMVDAQKSAEYLHKKYPELTKIFYRKKTNRPEIKLLHSKKTMKKKK